MIPTWLYVLGIVALGVSWFIQRRNARRSYAMFEGLPFVKFEDGNDTPSRYITDSKNLLHAGYTKYLKYGVPFRMRNPADPDHPQLILPFKYLDEVKMAPITELSFQRFSRQAFLLDYINAPNPTEDAAYIVRKDLNKHLGYLTEEMYNLLRESYSEQIPTCEDWAPFQPYMLFANSIARMTSLALAGPDLCRNEEWRNMMVSSAITLIQTAQMVRGKYPRYLRWIVPWIDPGAKKIYQNRHRCAELLRPYYERRLAGNGVSENKKPFVDGIQWLAEKSGKTTPLQIADDQLFLAMASIHSSSASTLSTLYDLCDRPESVSEILEEIQTVRANSKSSTWTKQALEQLDKLDSFMKESQRVHTVGQVTVIRSAVKPFTFSDGLRIPANTQCAFPSAELNSDGDAYPDPEVFDPHRFSRLRREIDPNKFHFAYVSEDSINFGAGTHSCPGRHFASNEIKLMLCEFLQNYEIRWPEGKGRPATMFHDFSSNPNPMADILIKRRA